MSLSTLTTSLQSAGSGTNREIELFFIELLKSSVFVPLKKEEVKINSSNIGNYKKEDLPYMFVKHEENSFLPIFSEENFLHHWAEREILLTEEKLSSLIWTLPQNTWLYLNPNQDIGKEISPWEVELLKRGEDAIADLVEGVIESEQDDLVIDLPNEYLLPLTNVLVPILEIYDSLLEAFLISIREDESKHPRAIIGIKYDSSISNEKKDYIRKEIQDAAEQHLVKPYTEVFIIDDLGEEKSISHNLFLDVSPFYQRKNL